jgi:hypothetical protein
MALVPCDARGQWSIDRLDSGIMGGASALCPSSQDPEDTIEHATVIYTRNAARLIGKHRLDGGPLIVAEFVAHDSRLQYWSLNHGSGSAINPLDYGEVANGSRQLEAAELLAACHPSMTLGSQGAIEVAAGSFSVAAAG